MISDRVINHNKDPKDMGYEVLSFDTYRDYDLAVAKDEVHPKANFAKRFGTYSEAVKFAQNYCTIFDPDMVIIQ